MRSQATSQHIDASYIHSVNLNKNLP